MGFGFNKRRVLNEWTGLVRIIHNISSHIITVFPLRLNPINHMKTVDDFIGNKSSVEKLCTWLTKYYHEPTAEIPNYCILSGISGNGKSFLPTLLANSFKVELFQITPLDITSMEDVNEVIKSINTTTLTGGRYKLVLIDDIDEYQVGYRTRLMEIAELSNHPVIFTCKKYVFLHEPEFTKNALRIKLNKPLTRELLNYLKTISRLDIHILDNIARQSKSVRSAILALYSHSPNSLINPIETGYLLFKTINKRQLTQVLNRRNIKYIFDAIRGYDEDALKVMERFAEFDYRIRARFEDIEPFFVNKMEEPIERVKLESRKKSKYVFKKKERRTETRTEKKKPKVAGPSLDGYI